MVNGSSKWQAAWAGVAGAVVGFAVNYILRVATPAPFLPEISAQLAIEYSPGAVTRQVIDKFGTNDKAIGTAIAFVAYFVAAIILGLIFYALRRRLPGRSGAAKGLAFFPIPLACTGIFMVVVLALQPKILTGYSIGASTFSLVVFNLIFAILLGWLAGSGEAAEESGGAARLLARRQFLFAGATIVAAAALTNSILRHLYQSYEQAVGAPSGKLPPFLTSNKDFYQVSKDLLSPRVDGQQWKLQVSGGVEHPFSVSYDELMQMPMQEQVMTLECISNYVGGPLISNARWRGVRLKALLDRGGLKPQNQEIVLRAVDGYSDSIPLQLALADDTMIALFMNGEKLPADHGFPARLLVPGLFGMENVKWLTGIEPIAGHHAGYWQQRGWEKFAVVTTMSKITVPVAGARLNAKQSAEITGVAFAGSRGIRAVEIAAAAGSQSGNPQRWMPAQLLSEPDASKITWTFWRSDWTPPTPGSYTIAVRATDGNGNLQTANIAPPFPNGATGYHAIQVQVS